jgi:hypothetical protein
MIMHFLHAGQERDTLPCTEEPMSTLEFITALFYHVDEHLRAVPKHPDAHLWLREAVTLGLLHALKGVGNRAFYRWLTRDYRPLFPRLPERTHLFRLFRTHQDWTQVFLASPTVLGVIDTYGLELIYPIRAGRSPQQIGRKGLSNHRWIVGGKLCLLVNQYGLVVAWDCVTANVGCVANFAQEVVKGQLPLAVGGIRWPVSTTVRPPCGPRLPLRPPAVVS